MPSPTKRFARTSAFVSLLSLQVQKRLSRPQTRRLLLLIALLLLLVLLLVAVCLRPRSPKPLPFSASARLGGSHVSFDPRVVDAARAKWVREAGQEAPPAMGEELWARVKNDVAICIKTGHEVARTRLGKLRTSGWWSVGRDVPNLLVVSDRDDVELGVVGVKSYAEDMLRRNGTGQGKRTLETPKHWWDKSGWRGDKDKNLPALHLLRTVFPGKKWYLLLDDDTYIFLENFARYVMQEGMDHRPVYTGKVFYISRCGGFARDGSWAANRSEPKGMFAHGGSGIVLNARAMEKVYGTFADCIREYSSCWAGDMQVGLCMRRSGVPLRKRHEGRSPWERHFTPFWPSKALSDRRYSQRWHSDEEPITFHQIPQGEQMVLSAFEKKLARDGDTVQYYELREHLLANGVLPFNEPRYRKFKWFSTEFFPEEMKKGAADENWR